MGSGFAKKQKHMRHLQQQMEQMQDHLKNSTFTGSSGNGLVTITIDGEKNLKSIVIQPACVDANDIEGLQDLICEAFRLAIQQVNSQTSSLNLSSLPF